MSIGCRLTVKDVRPGHDIRLNLISTERMDEEDYSGSFRNGKWKFYRGNLIVARAQKRDTLYTMHTRKSDANVTTDSSGELWHKRLCHMSEKGVCLLADQKLLLEVKGVHLEKCVDCLGGKQNIATFHSRPPRRREDALELLHIYVCYVDAPSHRGGQYFVTFIDDYNRKLWAFVLKVKDQVISFFKEREERDSGRKLKAVRTDNNGEYRG